MNSTLWLLLGLVIFCTLCLIAVFIGHCISIELTDADEPTYRTADEDQMQRDLALLRSQASITASHSKPKPTASTCCCDLQTTRAQAGYAALADLMIGKGVPVTPNPHTQGGLLYAVWASQYKTTTDAYGERGTP